MVAAHLISNYNSFSSNKTLIEITFRAAQVWWAIRTKPPTPKFRLIKIRIAPFNHDFMAGHTYQTANRPNPEALLTEALRIEVPHDALHDTLHALH